VRKVDKSRLITLPDRFGNKTSVELYTPEEQAQRDVQRQASGLDILAQAKAKAQANAEASMRHNQLTLEGGGIPAPAGLEEIGWAPGTPMTRAELAGATQTLDEHLARKKALKIAGIKAFTPDQDVYDFGDETTGQPQGQAATPTGLATPAATPAGLPTPAAAPTGPTAAATTPGTPPAGNIPGARLVGGGGNKRATGEFGAYLRAALMKSGYTEQNAPPDLVMKATTDYAQKGKNPEDLEQARAMRALTMEMTQARLDQMRSQKGSAVADYQPGSREYQVAQDLAYGKLTMPQFRSLTAYSRDTNKKMDIYQKASELNPNFNPAGFEMGYKLAASPKVQQQLASMDNVKRGIPDLLQLSDQASRTGVPILNQALLKGGLKIGNKSYSNFKTARTAFADELSGALGFGSASDMSKQMGLDMTDPNLSPEAFRSAVQDVVAPFIERKKQTLLDQMGVYGQPGMNPAAAGGAGGPVGGAGGAGGKVEKWEFDSSGKLVKR
jgi:hypothetical protein